MIPDTLKKSILVSLSGHLVIFSIFGFSFGNKIPRANFSCVRFWGQIVPLLDTNYHESKYELPRIPAIKHDGFAKQFGAALPRAFRPRS